MLALGTKNAAVGNSCQHQKRQQEHNPTHEIARHTQWVEAEQLVQKCGVAVIHSSGSFAGVLSRTGLGFAEIRRFQSKLDSGCDKTESDQIVNGYAETCEIKDQIVDKLDLCGGREDSEVHGYTHKLNKTRYKCRSNSTAPDGSMLGKDIGKHRVILLDINILKVSLHPIWAAFVEKSRLMSAGMANSGVVSC